LEAVAQSNQSLIFLLNGKRFWLNLTDCGRRLHTSGPAIAWTDKTQRYWK